MARHSNMELRLASLTAVIMLIVLLMGLTVGPPAPARAGTADVAVLQWNKYSIDALVNPPAAPIPGMGQSPPVSAIHLAIVHAAVYDAVNSIDGGHEPYLEGLPPADPSASQAAAAATAAYQVLSGLVMFPPFTPAILTRLADHYDDSIDAASATDGPAAVAAGIAAGTAAADAVLDARSDDGRYDTFSFVIGTGPGEWDGPVLDPFAWVAIVDPFTLKDNSQFRTKGPHDLKTGAYAKEYAEVKDLGGNGTTTPTLRTPEQTALADFYTVSPVEMFNRTFRTISEEEGLSAAEQARLFAMVNLAGADSLIACWDDKAHYSFWRPQTAIRKGDLDGNQKTKGDLGWTPKAGNPPYPDHPSGYNCVTGGMMHAAEDFFGKPKMPFSLIRIASEPDVKRDYDRFTDVIDDTIDARIYQGIHFRSADEQGAGIGRNVAGWLDRHYFGQAK